MGRLLGLIGVLALAGCGGEVLVETSDPTGEPTAQSPDGNPGSRGCRMCGVQPCGLCEYEGGDLAFACRDGGRPPADWDCLETGSVYAEGDDFYECWRCFVE